MEGLTNIINEFTHLGEFFFHFYLLYFLLIIPKEVLYAFREIICFYEYNQAIQAEYKCTTAHFAANLSG